MEQNFFPVGLRKNLRPFYYTNRGYISIIKWPWIFYKIPQKKVLLHTKQSEKPSYVVRSQVGNFILQ